MRGPLMACWRTRLGLRLDPSDPSQLVLFPEMIARDDPPEITTACWQILGKNPADIMCASQRMVHPPQGCDAGLCHGVHAASGRSCV